MFVILGASGHTGAVVAETLLKKREKVRAVGAVRIGWLRWYDREPRPSLPISPMRNR